MRAATSPEHFLQALRRSLARQRGITLDPATGEPAIGGSAVCVGPEWSRALRWPEVDEALLDDWVGRLVSDPGPGRYIGAWHDPTRSVVWVERAHVVDDHEEALRYAAKARQEAVYDLDRERWIAV